MGRVELAQARLVRGDQGRCRELAELGNRQLFVVAADGGGLVEDARALRLGQFQQVGAVDVFHIERRVLALDDGVEVGQAGFLALAGTEPVGGVARQGDLGDVGCHNAVRQGHIALLEGVHRVAALDRLAHHGEGRILVGLEAGQRVGEEGDFHGRIR